MLLGVGSARGQYRNYSLQCLAPLLQNLDPETPRTLQEALLAGPKHPAEPLDGIGSDAIAFPVSTESKEAQQFFAQGIALLHVLDYEEAERAFRTVIEFDPDCPMGYWGLAQANERKTGRARVYARAARERCDVSRPRVEQKWIEILDRFYEEGLEDDLAARSSERLHALEDLALEFPDHEEIRAFLLRRLTLDPFLAGLPAASALGIDSLAREFAGNAPEHPSRHYRAFLWMKRRPDLVLTDTPAMIRLSPGASEVWRYAAEFHRAAGHSAEAISLTEAALRIDHADLSNRNLLPWESQSLPGNYEALISILTEAGRIDEAVHWAKRALSLPRKDRSQIPRADSLWAEALLSAGLWERLLHDLESDPLLRSSRQIRDRANRLLWAGLAHLALGEEKEAGEAAKRLAELEREALFEGATPSEEKALAESRRTLASVSRFLESTLGKPPGDPSDKLSTTLDPVDIPLLVKARFYDKAGRSGDAYRLLQEDCESRPYRWLPTALFCRIAWDTGHLRDALFRFDRRFRSDAERADAGLPLFDSLAPVAEALKVKEPWTLPAPDPEIPMIPAERDDLGPETWSPGKAPEFVLPDRLGKSWSLSQFSDRPVLLNFFLGVRCAFCLKQFETFQPHLADYAKSGIEVLAVSSDPVEELRSVLGGEEQISPDFRERFSFPVLADPDLETFRNFGVFDDFEAGPMHATILLAPGGKILWSNIGHAPFEDPLWLLREANRLLTFHRPDTNR